MKRDLLLGCAVMLAATSVQAQQPQLDGQLDQSVAQEVTLNQTKKAGETNVAVGYMRPRGSFYCSYYTKDTQKGLWGYYAPWLHVTPYTKATYVNTSTGTTEHTWSTYVDKLLDKKPTTSTERDFTVPYALHLNDTVPTLVAKAGDKEITYFMGGYNKSKVYKPSFVWTYPNWKYARMESFNTRHMWESSTYFALGGNRDGSSTSAGYYHTLDAQYAAQGGEKAYTFGRNTAGYDYSAIAFEKPAHPYLINRVGVKYQRLKWSKDANALLKAEIYEIESIPAYDDAKAVTPKLKRRIASGLATIDNSTATSGMLPILVKDDEGGTPEINSDILVVVSGYNADGISDFTLQCSSDKVDEGYGELGYVGITGNDGKITFKGVNHTIEAGFYSAPSIFIETERPWLTYRSNIEPEAHDFLPTGELYYLELFSYQPASTWTITTVEPNAPQNAPKTQAKAKIDLPSWIKLQLKEDTGSEMGFATIVQLDVEALPAGVDSREATIRFAYPGAYLDYHLTQHLATGVTVVEASEAGGDDAPVYNMMGQRVHAGAKGLLIKNGKKVLVK